jgi:uncharacterized protein YidB (DUF937 family)
MGLLDILNGMQNGPRGQRQPGASGSGGGMSPLMIGILGLLAYKAFKGSGTQSPKPQPHQTASGTASDASSGGLGDILGRVLGGTPAAGGRGGGGLADMLPGGLGGLLGGAAAGTLVSRGLGGLLNDFQQSGHGREAESWVGTGPNHEIAPNDLANALGSDTLDALSRQTGMGREELLSGLSQHLPDLVDQLTPKGRVPTHEEASQML